MVLFNHIHTQLRMKAWINETFRCIKTDYKLNDIIMWSLRSDDYENILIIFCPPFYIYTPTLYSTKIILATQTHINVQVRLNIKTHIDTDGPLWISHFWKCTFIMFSCNDLIRSTSNNATNTLSVKTEAVIIPFRITPSSFGFMWKMAVAADVDMKGKHHNASN